MNSKRIKVDPAIIAIVKEQGPKCHYCGVKTKLPKTGRNGRIFRPEDRTLDHKIPRSRGGTDDRGNLVVCCRGCNLAKDDRTPEEWRRKAQ